MDKAESGEGRGELESAAAQILRSYFSGVLSTHSVEFPGYPFGSVVPFCLDETGQPLILISALAQHTRNIAANPKVALTLIETGAGDVQQDARLTLLADVEAVAEGDVAASANRYYRYFPESRGYHDQMDFRFYRLRVQQLRYIGGFGKIRWLAPDAVLQTNPFTPQREADMVGHMNDDHANAVRHYCDLVAILHQDQTVTLAGIQAEGMVLKVGPRLHYIAFDRSVTTPDAARAVLVELARRPLAAAS
ncbi:MAG TPA: DUF2470 domain-containing protein [Dongiaceae bacterium]|nr:DUF2470 domain-containing protein [Dongiaceae bacterium]